VDTGAGVGLAGVVTPRKRNKAARNRDNWGKKRADNVLDDKAEPAPLGVERAQRLAKKAETKGRAPSAAKAGHTAVWAGAKAKAIEDQEADVDARERVGCKTARAKSAMRTAQQLHQRQRDAGDDASDDFAKR
jgi:hypothetical protein